MRVSGLIYDSSWQRSSGAVWLDLPTPDVQKRTVLPRRAVGLLANTLFLIGTAGLLLTMLPVAAMEVKYRLQSTVYRLSPEQLLITDQSSPTFTPQPAPANEMEAFSVHIPKIDAHSVIIPNVDASDPQIYTLALKKGVAHALGTGLPGVESEINRTIYLFAHSTSAPASNAASLASLVAQYNAQFYLLHQLELGDELMVTFWAQDYQYRVRETKIVEADDVTWLQPQTDEELLVLATCTPPGTTWKRLLVIAQRDK